MSSVSNEGNIIISSKPQTVRARCLALMATSSWPGTPEGIIVLTSGEGSAVVVTDDGSAVAILPRNVGTVILGDGEGGILEADRKRGALQYDKVLGQAHWRIDWYFTNLMQVPTIRTGSLYCYGSL